ncbi:hypothetical protein GTZ97_02165 [Aquabacterium fontiphilum]|jgi:hypothetical protein|uniref:chalcone isomerase family protein n=1 Tax=Aquabacterium fontiphilum TaxID=450365 RepID=UPI00137842AC|nr:chalcone isomerase family protein [Aquabacterium fontiphilum]NBD19479.1 hypothetical protein [Aquabacterium fontiphilum]
MNAQALSVCEDAMLTRRQWLSLAAGAACLPLSAPAHADYELEGVRLEDSMTAYGQKLVLNGAGVRRRGYHKSDVVALYLPERRTTPEAIYKLDGVRRIQLNLLRDLSSSTISRVFLSDFKQVATDEEFKKLIEPLGMIGAAYANIRRVSKGDVVNLDWVPGRGWMATHNGRQLSSVDGVLAIKDELAYQIYLRMYLGNAASAELRNGLLGLTKLERAS